MSHLTDDLLNRYIDEELEVSEINFINTHIAGCPLCAGKVKNHKRAHSLLLVMKEESPSARFTNLLMSKIERSRKRRKEQAYFFSFIIGFLLLIVLGILGYFVSTVSFDSSGSLSLSKYINASDEQYKPVIAWMQNVIKNQNLKIVGSVLSLGILISAYFFYDTRKAVKQLLK